MEDPKIQASKFAQRS